MKRSSRRAIGSFGIQFSSDAHGVRIDLGHHVEGTVDLIDSRNICLLTLRSCLQGDNYILYINKIDTGEMAAFKSGL